MKGSAFAEKLPAGKKEQLPLRDRMIFDAVRRGNIVPIQWSTVESKYGPYTARIRVSNDALKVGEPSDNFRATVSHRTAQRIVDHLGYTLPTAKISDLIFQQAKVRLVPITQPKWSRDGTMALTRRMLQNSKIVDKAIGGRPGLTSNVGKDWVTTKQLFKKHVSTNPDCEKGPERAANYGWHWSRAPNKPATPYGGRGIWQNIGLCHVIDHVDYSQVVRLVDRKVQVYNDTWGGWKTMDIEKMVRDPAFAPLVSHEGTLLAMRHPHVPAGEALTPPEPDPTEGDDDTWKVIAGLGVLAAVGYWAVTRRAR